MTREVPRLRDLEKRGAANGLEGLRWLDRDEMREIEPHVGGVAALRVPQEGIVDYTAVCDTLAAKLSERGARVVTGARVKRLRRQGAGWIAETTAGEFEADFLINCAGLQCDRVAQLAGERRDMRIVPFRGEYYKLRPERQHLVRNLIYPVPDPRFPFLGVHFTRLIHGGVEAGPNAVLAFAREGYRKTDFNPRDLADALTYAGLLALPAPLSLDVLVRAAALLQPPIVLPFAAAPGARNPARRPRYRRLRRARAGHCARRRAGAGLPLHRAAQCAPRAQRAQPRRHGVAGHRRGDRRHGGAGGRRVAAIPNGSMVLGAFT